MDIEDEILAFIKERKEARWMDLEKAFVEKRDYSKGKFVHHLKVLKRLGKIKKRLSEEHGRPVYYIPKEYESEAEKAEIRESLSKLELQKLTFSKKQLEGILIDKYGSGRRSRESFKVPHERKLGLKLVGLPDNQIKKITYNTTVRVLYSPGESPPSFTNDEIASLLILMSRHSLTHETGEPRNPFYLIISHSAQGD